MIALRDAGPVVGNREPSHHDRQRAVGRPVSTATDLAPVCVHRAGRRSAEAIRARTMRILRWMPTRPATPSCFFAARFPGGFFDFRYCRPISRPLSRSRRLAVAGVLLWSVVAVGCASTPELPYPAFVNADEVPDSFVAGLPGVRAKRLTGNPETRRSSSLMTLPAGWQFTTGGLPDKSVEIFVIAGTLNIGSIPMRAGSYAFLPAASQGLDIQTATGAEVLYFLDDANDADVIQTPMIVDAGQMEWETADSANDAGRSTKVLREDPGSGARTWLLRVQPGIPGVWRQSAQRTEGFLLTGTYHHVECLGGDSVLGEYRPGGYFMRPADVVHGGPDALAIEQSIWFLRRQSPGPDQPAEGCSAESS